MRNIIGESYYYMKYFLRNKIRTRNEDWVYNHYVGKPCWDMDTLNHKVADMIASGEPFMMGRFGATELFDMRVDEFHQTSKAEKACQQLCSFSGFFPEDTSLLPRFNELMKESCKEVDILGVWQNPCEDYFIKHYCNSLQAISKLISIEPWRNDFPWSSALKGKKVLVIHPFEDSILSQYKNYDKLFTKNPQILPEFELKTLKAVQTVGNQTDSRFANWFEALDWMCAECEKIDFDIALIGCGAYGFHLAAHIKKMGKQAIHLGGCLQILFGLKGRRWDELEPDIAAMYNEYWHYPLASELPEGSGDVEGGTYWKKEEDADTDGTPANDTCTVNDVTDKEKES